MLRTKGFSLLELLVAFSILTIALVCGLGLYAFNQDSFAKGRARENIATQIAAKIKEFDLLSLSDFDAIVSTTTSTNNRLIQMTVKTLDPFTKEVSLTSPALTLKRTFYDINRKAQQSTCSLAFSRSWSSSIVQDSAALSGSSTATSLKVQNGIAYVGADSAKAADPDLYIFDISDSAHLHLLAELNTGPGVTDVTLSWPYLFLANTSINSQLQVVDVSVPNSPLLKVAYKLPGDYKDGGYIGNSISIYGNTIALGTKKSDGPEFHLIDISQPLLPIEINSLELGTAANSIWLESKSALIVTPLDEVFSIISIGDSLTLSHQGGFNAQTFSSHSKSIYKLDDVYIGRTVGEDELLITNTSSTTIKSSVNTLFVRDHLAFLATIDPHAQFQVWDVASSTSPFLLNRVELNGKAVDIDCDKENLFVAISGSPALYSVRAAQ